MLELSLQKIQKINQEVFDNIDKWAKEQGASGLAYFTIEQDKEIKEKDQSENFLAKLQLKK